mmetsp:Transcript_25206/g.36017  ORF Transcript_25206/g.36017 Transcript_25206/m.36017 type:complete len:332 (+) Transcript_25206:206-1201(+)
MSEDKDNGMVLRCASCGIAEVDSIKMKNCAACYLVRYCSIECQRHHWSKHKRDCKKRVAELRDELLFRQPESTHLGDCPICMIPLSLDRSKSTIMSCCSKVICIGCTYANHKREVEMRLERVCPFCREPTPETLEQSDKLRMKRVEANDPFATSQEGEIQYKKGDYKKSFEYWTKAAELGDAEAHLGLAFLNFRRGIEKKERGKPVKAMCHMEEAAIGGFPEARHQLGYIEWEYGNTERAVKHWLIAAAQGHNNSTTSLREGFVKGAVEKDTFAAALRAHQVTVNATKSSQREIAEEECHRQRANKSYSGGIVWPQFFSQTNQYQNVGKKG